MSIAGTWNVSIHTPIGTQHAVLALTEQEGVVGGLAQGDDETMPLINPVLTGNRLTWTQEMTKPMRLRLRFAVSIDGDTLTGTSKVGILPPSRVTGTRATEKRDRS